MNDLPQNPQSNIGAVMQRAFDCMSKNTPVILSDKGKIELEKCWEDSSKEIWEIQAVWCHDRITICSENHLIFNEAPLDWFVWHVA